MTTNSSQTFFDHGNPELVCRTTRPVDVISFFLLNYVAYAATVKTLPGESGPVTILNILAALFFPASGVFRGIAAFFSFAKFGKTDLEVAARAGALCTVVQWPPQQAEISAHIGRYEASQPVWSILETNIHGRYELPTGYALAVIPPDARFENDIPDHRTLWQSLVGNTHPARHGQTKISCSYNMVKIVVALVQLLYAITTLYQSRGEQVEWYGFSAFGLTVAPYAWMSLVNLCANLMCPEYPAMYLVGSNTMTEAAGKLEIDQDQAHALRFDGIAGRLTKTSEHAMMTRIARHAQASFEKKTNSLWTRTKNVFRMVGLTGLAASVPLLVIGLISKFKLGSHGTAIQQMFVSIWLLYGVYFGVVSPLLLRTIEERPILNVWASTRQSKIARPFVVLTFLFSFAAIGGFYSVGRMLSHYGICIPVG